MQRLYFILLIMLPVIAAGQRVKVVDKTSLQPMPGVAIFTSDRKISVSTAVNGEADLSVFKGADSLHFRITGYKHEVFSLRQLEAMKFMVLLSEKSYDLDEVVVSASRFEEKKADVPQQIEVLRAKDLAMMNQPTTADVLQQTGSVLVQKSQAGGGSPIIRGFEANKVLMVVDGIRMNNAIYRGGHLQNSITIDNAMLDKMEIVFGPGSVVYGSDALGGVMHFHTRNPVLADSAGKTSFKTNIFTRYATAYDENTAHIDLNIGFKKFGIITSATFSDFGDLRQGNIRNPFYGEWGKSLYYADHINGKDTMIPNPDHNIQKNSGYSQYDIMQKLLYRQNRHVDHILNLQYSTSSNIPRYDRLSEYNAFGTLKNAEWYYGPQERMLAAYSISLSKETKLYNHARAVLAWQGIEESRHNRSFGKNELNNRIENVKVMSANIDFDKKINEHELRYGLEGNHNDVQSEAYFYHIKADTVGPLDTRYPQGGSSMRTLAAYFTHTWEISEKLIVSDGARYSDVRLDADFGDTSFFSFPYRNVMQRSHAINGNIGLVYMPSKDWRFTIVGSSGFRAPNVDDLAKVFESTPGQVIIPNPDLEPEYTYNGEAGIQKVFNDKVKAEAVGWYTWYLNAVTTEPFLFNGQDSILYNGQMSQVTANVNARNAYIYGASADLAADVSDNFSITSTITYTYGRILTDTADYPLDHIPPVFGRTGFNLKLKKFRGEFFVMYNGWKRLKDYNIVGEDNIQFATPYGTPAWMTLNVRTAYHINKFIQAQLAVENILDQNYRVFASGISSPGRNLVVTLRGSF